MRCDDPLQPPLEKLFGNQLLRRKQFFLGDSVLTLFGKRFPPYRWELGPPLKSLEKPKLGYTPQHSELEAPTNSKLRMRCAIRLTDFYLQGPNQNRDPSVLSLGHLG